MVDVTYTKSFKKSFKKIKDKNYSRNVKNQIKKILNNPNIGKPMRYGRKGTREIYVSPYRLAYAFHNNEIIFLEIYHKDFQ